MCHYRIDIMLLIFEGNVVEAIDVVPHNKTQQAAIKQLIILILDVSFFNNTFREFFTVAHSHFD